MLSGPKGFQIRGVYCSSVGAIPDFQAIGCRFDPCIGYLKSGYDTSPICTYSTNNLVKHKEQ